MIKNATIFKVNQTGLTTNQPKFEGVDIDAVHAKRAPNLTHADSGPGFTPAKRPGTVIPNEPQKQWSSGTHIHRSETSSANANMFQRPTYSGAELAPYQGRPEANNHMQHGSVVGGKWQPYTTPGLMCVGAAGPVALQPAARGRFAA